MKSKNNRHAFTLVELLVVIAILAVLVSLLLPALNKAVAMSRSIKCAANLQQIGMGFMLYRTVYNNYLPPVDAYISHMPIGSDWALGKDYGMWNAIGPFLGFPEWGGVMDATGVVPAPVDDANTGYIKSASYWGAKAGGGRKYIKSIFICPETWSYDRDSIGPWSGSGYGESVYLQRYPSGPGTYNWPSSLGAAVKTTGYGLPRQASAIKHTSQAVQVSEKGGNNHTGSPKFLPDVATLTLANYPPRKIGSESNQFDMYRHFGGCNILFADGHVSYYKGTDILKNIVKDSDPKSMRNYNMP